MRWAGEAEAVRRDLVMGVLLNAGTGMPRFRKSKAPSALALDGAFAPKFGMVVMKEADPNSICRGLSLTEAPHPSILRSVLSNAPWRSAGI
ncbi:hypothetical protein GCM10010990_22930 [Croceicoccus mobilis]|uniref:Uncharacterized protein n=1 Tax=Croceicoccus mobilis TaxID=1703339 RepID=A0A917DUW5_9SPHN|nr:hypothetical protein GCM10010990_22930 [Croceicoccus mobilis]